MNLTMFIFPRVRNRNRTSNGRPC